MVGKFLLAQRQAFGFLFFPPKLYLEDRPGMKTLLGYSLKPVKCQEAKKAVPEDWANQNLRMRLRELFSTQILVLKNTRVVNSLG